MKFALKVELKILEQTEQYIKVRIQFFVSLYPDILNMQHKEILNLALQKDGNIAVLITNSLALDKILKQHKRKKTS